MSKFKKILKDWALIITMVVGASMYLVYHAIPALHPAGPVLLQIVKKVQPVLLFLMLFLSFCKVEPRQMKPHRWMIPLLAVQCLGFMILAAFVYLFPDSPARVPLEAAMLCLICPTATACAVVTGRLGGSMASVVTYTVIINLAVALLVPLVVPVIYPMGGMSFGAAFVKILSKVFPLLILPCLLAWLLRWCAPKVHGWFVSRSSWSFDIWVVSLSLAILMSTRAIVNSGAGVLTVSLIALASLITCVLQFAMGHWIGKHSKDPLDRINAGQALGQKNTVFAIWMGYTFLDPITSVAGGFYSIWHNVYNSLQLRRKAHEVSA